MKITSDIIENKEKGYVTAHAQCTLRVKHDNGKYYLTKLLVATRTSNGDIPQATEESVIKKLKADIKKRSKDTSFNPNYIYMGRKVYELDNGE